MKALKVPGVLVINKIDTLEQKDKLLEVIDAISRSSTLTPAHLRPEGMGCKPMDLTGYPTEGPQMFPEDMTTDQPERQVMAEILGKMLRLLQRRSPHGTAVEITRFSERDNEIVDVEATIYCEKASHKGIIIGKQGAMLKKFHLRPKGHGAVHGHQGVFDHLGEGEGELAGQPGGHPQLWLLRSVRDCQT